MPVRTDYVHDRRFGPAGHLYLFRRAGRPAASAGFRLSPDAGKVDTPRLGPGFRSRWLKGRRPDGRLLIRWRPNCRLLRRRSLGIRWLKRRRCLSLLLLGRSLVAGLRWGRGLGRGRVWRRGRDRLRDQEHAPTRGTLRLLARLRLLALQQMSLWTEELKRHRPPPVRALEPENPLRYCGRQSRNRPIRGEGLTHGKGPAARLTPFQRGQE